MARTYPLPAWVGGIIVKLLLLFCCSCLMSDYYPCAYAVCLLFVVLVWWVTIYPCAYYVCFIISYHWCCWHWMLADVVVATLRCCWHWMLFWYINVAVMSYFDYDIRGEILACLPSPAISSMRALVTHSSWKWRSYLILHVRLCFPCFLCVPVLYS